MHLKFLYEQQKQPGLEYIISYCIKNNISDSLKVQSVACKHIIKKLPAVCNIPRRFGRKFI